LNNILFNMLATNLKIKDVKSEIGQLVKSYRKREKLSRQELAEKLELSRITIQNLESGKNFTIDTLLKVLQYFDLLHAFNDFMEGKRMDIEQVKSLY
jgi:transcriptional regulator with XRE-family HTH domain